MNKSIITISVSTILLFVGFQSATPVEISQRNVLYVDDDNTVGPWDGTLEHPYQHIYDAVENASDDDTIRVYAGIYTHEYPLRIDKTLALIGNGSDSTYIKGSNLKISKDNVIVRGFTIHGYDHNPSTKVCCIKLEKTKNCNINNNTLPIGLTALELYECTNTLIENNCILIDSNKPIVYLFSSHHTIMRSNVITNATYGTYLDHCHDNQIENNTFGGSSTYVGVYVISSDSSIIRRNLFNGCYKGIMLVSSENMMLIGNKFDDGDRPIDLSSSHNNTIEDNILKNIWGFGMNIRTSNRNVFRRNNITRNDLGIALWSSNDNIIEENIITNNEGHGIQFDDSNNNTVTRNRIMENKGTGILLYGNKNIIKLNSIINNEESGIFVGESADNNIITRNTIQKNGNTSTYWTNGGVLFYEKSLGNTVTWNTIEDNENFGISASSSWVNARFNWWGSPFGPSRTDHLLRGQRIVSKMSIITAFPWLLFPLAIDE